MSCNDLLFGVGMISYRILTRWLLVSRQFPLLSKCLLLQALCAEPGCGGDGDVIELAGFPGGAEAFEVCAKFCYGITITVSARNLVPLRCADHQ